MRAMDMDTETEQSYNVLLVNNDHDVYNALKKILSEINHNKFNIDWISDYSEAIKAIENSQHDLVFLDYQLDTNHTGMDLLQEINAHRKNMPFIMLTGKEHKKFDQEAVRLGVADFLTKDQLNKTLIERSIRYSIERQRLINQINRLAHFDSLTDLPNRLSFDRALRRYVASAVRYNRKSAVLLIDLDHFKTLNESYGRDVGDLVLQEVSQRLKHSIRDSDYAARVESNKFAVILNEIATSHDAGVTAKKLCESINESLHIRQHDIKITASIGIVIFPNETKSGMDLMQCAEIALSRVKQQFRNSYQFYRRELHEEHTRKLSLERLMLQSIANDELYLTYQPIIDLENQNVVGMETFIRWHCKQLNQDVPLDEFIPLAEETGFINEVGEWVVKHALEELQAWQQHGYDGYLTINISARQLHESIFTTHLLKKFSGLVDDSILKIKIEIHEDAMVPHNIVLTNNIAKLHEFGLEIFIDRFDSSYCSIKQIQELNIKALKIDKALIKISTTEEGECIIKSIIALAKPLGVDVIAEGIENDQQRQALISWGCKLGQGYFYSKPLITSQMTQYLKTHNKLKGLGF